MVGKGTNVTKHEKRETHSIIDDVIMLKWIVICLLLGASGKEGGKGVISIWSVYVKITWPTRGTKMWKITSQYEHSPQCSHHCGEIK